MDITNLTDDTILSLGPSHLMNRNTLRYQGQKERTTLAAFAPADRQLLKRAYATMLDLGELLQPVQVEPSSCREILENFIRTPAYLDLIPTISQLGHATAEDGSHDVNRLVHDLRGGAFQALSLRLQLFEVSPEKETGMQNIYFLVRDHLKIMRNCVSDLDPPRFAADSATIAHDVNLLIEKWSLPEFNVGLQPVRIDLRCRYAGTLCESCLEFSSLDRIVYNLMNNAARFTKDNIVLFGIVGIPAEAPEVVRFVVANAVTPEHREALAARFGDEPGELFRGGFTTGGHGVGARICADFCAHAFGISDFDEALNSGYFGARWIEDMLVTWFHWPIVAH
jgi:hypothetical protein